MESVLFATPDATDAPYHVRLEEVLEDLIVGYYAMTAENTVRMLEQNKHISLAIVDHTFHEALKMTKTNARIIVTSADFTYEMALEAIKDGAAFMNKNPLTYFGEMADLILANLPKPDNPSSSALEVNGQLPVAKIA